jgi:hypothetical protein
VTLHKVCELYVVCAPFDLKDQMATREGGSE